jgi:hypothetical protein
MYILISAFSSNKPVMITFAWICLLKSRDKINEQAFNILRHVKLFNKILQASISWNATTTSINYNFWANLERIVVHKNKLNSGVKLWNPYNIVHPLAFGIHIDKGSVDYKIQLNPKNYQMSMNNFSMFWSLKIKKGCLVLFMDQAFRSLGFKRESLDCFSHIVSCP